MLKIKYYILFSICTINFILAQGQNNNQKIFIINVIDEISDTYKVAFNYESHLLENIKVFPLPKNNSLYSNIDNLEKQTNLIFSKISNAVITITESITICGYIRDTSKNPLSGATINGGANYFISDDSGYFQIQLSSLDEVVTIRFIGFKTIESEAKFFNLNECNR